MLQEIIIQARASAEHQMEADALLLKSLATRKRCILNFYNWEASSVTYGYFIDPFAFLNKEGISKHQLQLARRPTGGGMIFHHCDLAFSVLVPNTHPRFSLNTLDNYAFINAAIEKAIALFRGGSASLNLLQRDFLFKADEACSYFCMAKPTSFDVMLEGRKVGGGAQRKSRHGYLHQGTIAIALPKEEFLNDLLLCEHPVGSAMRVNSLPLLGENYTSTQFQEAKKEMHSLLCQTMRTQFTSFKT